jgi:hypothetical protein
MSLRFAGYLLLFDIALPALAAEDDGEDQARTLAPWSRGIVYGRAMLTPDERKQYWEELQAFATDEEKRAYWEAHIERMQRLAIERGVAIEPPPNAPRRVLDQRKFSHAPYFRELMTTEEQDAYRDAVWHINDDDVRNHFVSSHVLEMRQRAISRGVTYPGLGPYEKQAVETSGMDVNPMSPSAGEIVTKDAAAREAASEPEGEPEEELKDALDDDLEDATGGGVEERSGDDARAPASPQPIS